MKKIFLLTISTFALGLDAYVMAGLLIPIGTSFHANISQVGQTVTVFTLCYALAAPIFATLLARKPVHKMLALALVIFSIGNAISALSNSLSLLLLARAIAGIGAGLYSPMAAAAATQLVPTKKRGRALGFIIGGMSTGTVIGVPLGLIIAKHFGWQATLWLITGLGCIALTGLLAWFSHIPSACPPSFRQRLAMLTNIKIASIVGISFLTAIASLGLYTYLAPVLHATVGIKSITPYLWVWGIGGVLGSFSIGSLIDRSKKPRQLMAYILAIMMLAIVVW